MFPKSGLDASRDDIDDFDVKWCKFNPQRIRVRVQSSFGSIIDAAEQIWNNTGQTTNHHNRAFGLDEQR
jgi:hypothetical protein